MLIRVFRPCPWHQGFSLLVSISVISHTQTHTHTHTRTRTRIHTHTHFFLIIWQLKEHFICAIGHCKLEDALRFWGLSPGPSLGLIQETSSGWTEGTVCQLTVKHWTADITLKITDNTVTVGQSDIFEGNPHVSECPGNSGKGQIRPLNLPELSSSVVPAQLFLLCYH